MYWNKGRSDLWWGLCVINVGDFMKSSVYWGFEMKIIQLEIYISMNLLFSWIAEQNNNSLIHYAFESFNELSFSHFYQTLFSSNYLITIIYFILAVFQQHLHSRSHVKEKWPCEKTNRWAAHTIYHTYIWLAILGWK